MIPLTLTRSFQLGCSRASSLVPHYNNTIRWGHHHVTNCAKTALMPGKNFSFTQKNFFIRQTDINLGLRR